MPRLEGRSVLLTGATAGIGRATALRLAEEGALLTLIARGREAGAALVAELPAGRARFLAADVADPASAARAVHAALDAHGRLDVLVNNAGMDLTAGLLDTSEADLRAVFEVNVFGAWRLLVAAARQMEPGGAIVNVTSRLAAIGVPTMSGYGASKGALDALTRHAAVELAPRGIRVNAVAPGLTETPLVEHWRDGLADGVEAAARAAIPQGRFGRPEEVAAAIAFLASGDAAHITGTSLAVDGGYTAA